MGIILQDKTLLDQVLDVLESYPGDIPVIIAMDNKKYNSNCSIRRCEGIMSELKGYVQEKDIIFFKKK